MSWVESESTVIPCIVAIMDPFLIMSVSSVYSYWEKFLFLNRHSGGYNRLQKSFMDL